MPICKIKSPKALNWLTVVLHVILRVAKQPHPKLHPAFSHHIEKPMNKWQSDKIYLVTSED